MCDAKYTTWNDGGNFSFDDCPPINPVTACCKAWDDCGWHKAKCHTWKCDGKVLDCTVYYTGKMSSIKGINLGEKMAIATGAIFVKKNDSALLRAGRIQRCLPEGLFL